MISDKTLYGEGWVWGRQIGYEGTKWCCYFWRSGWTHLSLGLHFDWFNPNIEIHLPLGFIRIGVRSEWHSFAEVRREKERLDEIINEMASWEKRAL